jgi:leucyl/phenylalanyl-tRNA--protein transferase
MIPSSQLITAYSTGYFPMAMQDGRIYWFSPDPRAVLPLDRVHLPRRLLRTMRASPPDVTVNRAFHDVIVACGSRSDEEGNWINDEIVESYDELHRRGWAHSVEVWNGEDLVGGLYGVSLGAAFFGESMFHRATDASKVALVTLVDRLKARGYELLDVQWMTPHLQQFGAIEVPRREYLRRLRLALDRSASFA